MVRLPDDKLTVRFDHDMNTINIPAFVFHAHSGQIGLQGIGLYAALAYYVQAFAKDGRLTVSQETLATSFNCSRKTIGHYLRVLADAGLLSITARPRETSVITLSTVPPTLESLASLVPVVAPKPKNAPKPTLRHVESFVEFSQAYPVACGDRQTNANWQTLMATGVDPAIVIQAARNYAVHVRRDNIEPRYIIRPANFIGKAERYLSFVDGTPQARGSERFAAESPPPISLADLVRKG